MIILKILKIILLTALGLLAALILLLCLPVTVIMRYESVSGDFELTVKYLFIPLRLLPKDEQSILVKLEKFSEKRKKARAGREEKKELFSIRLRNFMLQRRITRGVYRFFERLAEERRLKKLERLKKKRKAKQKPRPETEKKEKSTFAKLIEERGVGGLISWILELARIAGGMLRKTFKGIIIRRLDLLMDIGSEDAAQTAINYGRMCAVVLPALSIILSGVRRYHRKIHLRPDFDDPRIKALLDTELVIIPIAVVGHALMALLKIIAGEVKRQIQERMSRAAAESGQSAAAGK